LAGTAAITRRSAAATCAAAIACATAREILSPLFGASTKLFPRFDRVIGACSVEFLRCSLISIRNPFAVFGVVLPPALSARR
jgi:hypothetical protein